MIGADCNWWNSKSIRCVIPYLRYSPQRQRPLIDDRLREQAETTAKELQMLLLEPSANLENVQQLIDKLQQQIFAMGAAVYQQGTAPKNNAAAGSNPHNGTRRHTPLSRAAAPPPPPPPLSKQVASTLTLDYEDDETATTDYEVVE